ncbi:MAG: 3-ketoacyl-ACP reductase [Peptococcaceae bacterium BICA1-8]|nr:MAG: 3-ketoacyl-ACP reductase [Peptococcaceae bacterium BICA1-8]
MNIQGKVALITGGATGIGRAAALKLAAQGAGIIINYSKSEGEAVQTAQEISKVGVEVIICKADVAQEDEVKVMYEKIMEHFGRIDIIVNSAGTTDYVPLTDLDGMQDAYWDRAFNTNVKGIFHTVRVCQDELKRNEGCVINVTSIAGLTGQGSSIAYAASKAAANSVTKSLALALAPEVRVNAVAPGVVLTRWVAGKEDHVERLSQGTPLGRPADPEDIAQAIVSLITGGDFITGQVIVVDGGFTIK